MSLHAPSSRTSAPSPPPLGPGARFSAVRSSKTCVILTGIGSALLHQAVTVRHSLSERGLKLRQQALCHDCIQPFFPELRDDLTLPLDVGPARSDIPLDLG